MTINPITTERNRHVWYVSIILVLAVFVYNLSELPDARQHSRWYYLLGQAFGAGHTYIPIFPSPAMAQAFENKQYKEALTMPDKGEVLWTASLYKGKWYYYYGPTPGIVCATWMIFNSGIACTDALLGKIAALGVVLFFYFIVRELPALLNLRQSSTLMWFMIIIFAFGGIQMYMVGGELYTGVYHASIMISLCFLIGGFYFFMRYCIDRKLLWVFLLSLFFALALSSKVTSIIYIIFPVLAITFVEVNNLIKGERKRFIHVFASSLPLLLTVVALLTYNKVRFDNYFEFGIKYVYDEIIVREAIDNNNLYSWHNIGRNLYTYFFKIPPLSIHKPFITLQVDYPALNYWAISAFFLHPIIVLALFIPVVLKKIANVNAYLFFVPFIIGIVVNISNYLVWFGTVLRYSYEFVPFMFIFAFAVLLYLNGFLSKNHRLRWLFTSVFAIIGVWSVFVGCAMLMATTWGNR